MGHKFSFSCPCKTCLKKARAAGLMGDDSNSQGGGWTPRTVGTTDDDSVVTFKEGLGYNAGHTLIADGTPSGRAFDRRGEHNHYGSKREGDGRVEDDEDRSYYTGPGH